MDIDFLPMGFELAGAPGNGWATFLKKASKIAHERRGHNRAAFTRKWKARMAMTIAKRGAEAALEKVAKIAGIRKLHKHLKTSRYRIGSRRRAARRIGASSDVGGSRRSVVARTRVRGWWRGLSACVICCDGCVSCDACA